MWTVLPGRILGLIPYAHARKGSVVMKTFYGFAAVDRAQQWVEDLHR
jgi:hypothetical protein